MSCWCNDVNLPNYECLECEKRKSWKNINNLNRIKLKAYARMLSSKYPDDEAIVEMTKYFLDKKIDLLDIPEHELNNLFRGQESN